MRLPAPSLHSAPRVTDGTFVGALVCPRVWRMVSRRRVLRCLGTTVVLLTGVVTALGVGLAPSRHGHGVAAAQSVGNGPCGLTQPAFCDTFDQPSGIGNRSGQLNGIVWGVSRLMPGANFGQAEFNAGHPRSCRLVTGRCQRCLPPNDVIICNGQLREARTMTTRSPRWRCTRSSPFDFAGRTGIVTFDVSNDSRASIPPGPSSGSPTSPYRCRSRHFGSLLTVPRNGFGIQLRRWRLRWLSFTVDC